MRRLRAHMDARMELKGIGLRATPPLLLASLIVAPLAQLAEQLTLNQRFGVQVPDGALTEHEMGGDLSPDGSPLTSYSLLL